MQRAGDLTATARGGEPDAEVEPLSGERLTAADEAAGRSEIRLRLMADALPVLIAYIDADQCYRVVNAAYEDWFSLPREQIVGRPVRDLLQEQYEASRPHLERALAGCTASFEREVEHPRHGRRWVSCTYVPHSRPEGGCEGLYALIIDITDRKAAQQALEERERLLRLLTDALPVLMCSVDTEERYRFANATYAAWFGVSRTEILGKRVSEVVGEEGYAFLRPYIRRALSGETCIFERPVDTAGQGRRYVQSTCVPQREADGRVTGFYALAVDITERKRTEAALRDSEDKLRLAVEATDLGLWDYDIRSGALVWSDRLRAMYGLRTDEPVTFERYVAGLHPEDRDRVLSTYERALDPTGDGRFGTEHRVVLPDGGIRWVYGAGRVLFDDEGRPVRAIGTTRDITARKQAEAALQDSHARITEILESIDDAFFAVDHQWRFTYVNRHCERLWGRRREELLGRVMWEAFPQVLGSEPYRAYLKAAAERRPVRLETIAVTINRPVDLAIYPSPSGLSVYFRDISARKQAEERQMLLMAELDHRVKNTLAAIQAMVTQTAAGKRSAEAFAAALQGRIAALARAHSLLTQSRWEGAGLRQVMQEELRPYDEPPGARVTLAGDDLLLKPKAATAISMVVHELTTNSAKYGALSQPTGRVSVSWAIAGGRGGEMLRLDWVETGGPPAQAPDRHGFGTTLIERTLTYEFGGATRLEFAPEGVRCRIEVPIARIAVRSVAGAAMPTPPVTPPLPRRTDLTGARILVVEDSMLVALEVEATLSAAGAEVVGPATTLEQAVEFAGRERLDAAVLDVNLDGEAVFPVAELLLRRHVPFLFSTGYGSKSALPETLRGVPVLQKPFSGEALIQAVKGALAQAGAN